MQLVRKILILICGLSIYACSDRVLHQEKIEITSGVWDYGESLRFDFEVADTLPTYDMILNVHHHFEYEFQNLYVKMKTTFPNSKKDTITKLVSLQLMDPLNQWEGKCNSENCITPIQLRSKTYFPEVGAYSIEVNQYSRDRKLEGILALELLIVLSDT